ncbi:saoe class I histocompatibility antigen, A alpha chain-like [Erinaceus europaeus]|uniref:Saoe class I histocompatibility antigen, A alpha chain-like n=1 Tax=Erinaceus europaeus TaxID=9365 RepID=A0A1S3WWJ1_ERIEU|nr:saoe class I histocompatibility antigen, A alpha chain-like [Erinaceus europaeus]
MMSQLLLLLLLSGLLDLTKTWTGPHSLRVLKTIWSGPHGSKPHFIAVCYVDDTQLLLFDNDVEEPKVEHREPWVHKMEAGFLEGESRLYKHLAQVATVSLNNLRKHHNQSDTGFHTYQWNCGCETGPDARFLRGNDDHAYDGEDYMYLNEDLHSWIAVDKVAQINKLEWEATYQIELIRNELEIGCVDWLHKYLQYGKETLQHADPPKTHVTRKHISDHEATLKCWALGFYPAEITLIWQHDWQDLTQEMEFVETRPGGDGTFQKWAAVVVPSGEEQKYTCHVQHMGLPKPLNLRWEPPESPALSTDIIVSLLLLGAVVTGALVAGAVIWRKKRSSRKK